MSLLQLWWIGLWKPSRPFLALAHKPAPQWGLWAVLIRFVGTALTTTLALDLLGRTPFTPSYLTFLPTERYYGALVFVIPLFGLVAWLLMSAVAHLGIRLAGKTGDFDQTLNVIGLGMLIPMPAV